MTVSVFAPAKVNLTLHVTGQREDGLHLIDSLVAFAPVGDRLVIDGADAMSLTVAGPHAAGVPDDMENLVMKVAQIMTADRPLSMVLNKHLPVSGGVGGGSADAAAAARALTEIWLANGTEINGESALETTETGDPQALMQQVLGLGADISMCMLARPQRVRGIGDRCDLVAVPQLPAVLVNPRVAVRTADVFNALENKENAPMQAELPVFTGVMDFARWLSGQRNDLQAPATRICPEVGQVMSALQEIDGCLLARMSGSGATCFAIFSTEENARAAREKLRRDHSNWWISEGSLGDWVEKAAPVFS